MKARFAFLSVIAAAAALAACGGGGGGGGGNPPTSAPTPTGGPVSGNITFGTAASAPLPGGSFGVSGTLSIPAGSGTATFAYSTASPAPPGPPGILARRRDTSGSGNTGLVYLTFTATSNVTLNGVPGFTATLPSGAAPAGSAFYVAYYGQQSGQTPPAESPAWVSSSATAATVSGNTLTIPATSTPTFTLTTGQSLYFVLYYGYYIPVNNQFGCVGAQSDAAQRNLVGVTPPTLGSTWAYSGSLTDVIARSSPCPIPTASSAAAVAVTVAINSPPVGTATGFSDEHSVETDTYATNQTQVTTDAIVNGSVETSEKSTDFTGNTVATTYGGSGLTYSGPNSFTNAPPTAVNTVFVDGTTYARTYASDGSYQETDNLVGVSPPNTIQTNADGSASYNAYDGYYNVVATFTMTAPSGGNIVFTSVDGPHTTVLTIPQWFQTGAPLYSDATTVTASQTLDPSCTGTGLLGSGSSATEYARTVTTLDPALGYTETETIKSYVVPNYSAGKTVGPVCVVISDVQDSYYDMLLDTSSLAFVSPNAQPIQTDTLNETYFFSTPPVGDTRVRADAAAQDAANLALQASGFAHLRAVQRAQRIEHLRQAILHGQFKGVTR